MLALQVQSTAKYHLRHGAPVHPLSGRLQKWRRTHRRSRPCQAVNLTMMSPLLAGRCKSHRVSACSVDPINTCLMKPSLCCCSGSTFTSWKRALTERRTRWGFPETSLMVFSENTFVFSVCRAACMHRNTAVTCTLEQIKSPCHFQKAAGTFSAVIVSVFSSANQYFHMTNGANNYV